MARKLDTTITFPSILHNDRLIMRADTPTGVTTFKVPADVNKSNFIAYMADAGKPVRNADLRELPAECFEGVHKLKLVNCILPPLTTRCRYWLVRNCNVVSASAYGGEWEVILEYGKFKAESCKVKVFGAGQVDIEKSTASIHMWDSIISLTDTKARLRVEHSKCVFDNVVIMRDSCADPYIRDPYIGYSLVAHKNTDLCKVLHNGLRGTVYTRNMWYRFDNEFLHIYIYNGDVYAIAGCHKGKLVNVVRQLVDYRRYAPSSASSNASSNAIRYLKCYEANLSVLAVALQQMQLTYMLAASAKDTLIKAYRILEKANKTYQARKANSQIETSECEDKPTTS